MVVVMAVTVLLLLKIYNVSTIYVGAALQSYGLKLMRYKTTTWRLINRKSTVADVFQSEISRRREHEVQKLKKDLELILIERETSESSLKKRYQETINDLTDQLEQLNRQRNK